MAPTAARMPAAALLVLALLAAPALAQAPAPQVTLSLDADALEVGATQTRQVNGTVAYADAVPGGTANVALRVDAPVGWTATVDPASLPLSPGQSGAFTVTFQAPAEDEGTSSPLGPATVTATANAGPGRAPATATARVQLSLPDPQPPPPPDRTPLLVAIAATLLAALAVVLLGLRQRRRARDAAARAAYLARETGITLAPAGEPQPFGDRREVAQRLTVQNATDRPRVAVVEVKDVPPGWLAAVNVPRRELGPREAMTITLTARPPDGAPLGANARIVVAAKPEEAQELDERVTLDVQAPDARPAPPGTAPPLAHRNGSVPKTLRP